MMFNQLTRWISSTVTYPDITQSNLHNLSSTTEPNQQFLSHLLLQLKCSKNALTVRSVSCSSVATVLMCLIPAQVILTLESSLAGELSSGLLVLSRSCSLAIVIYSIGHLLDTVMEISVVFLVIILLGLSGRFTWQNSSLC